MRLERAPLDLGPGKPGDVVRGVFPIHNRGASPLDVQLSASCGCTELTPRAASIPPFSRIDVKVGVKLEAHGTERAINVAIKSNDPERSSAGFPVRASCPYPFEISPTTVDLGRAPVGSAPTRKLVVRPLKGSGPLSLEAEPSSERLRVTRETSEGGYVFTISLQADRPGMIGEHLTLTSKANGQNVRIPVIGEIVESLLVTPKILRIGRMPSGGEPERFVIVFRGDSEPPGRITPPHARGIRLEPVGEGERRRRMFKVLFDRTKLEAGSHNLLFVEEESQARAEVVLIVE